MSYSQLRQTQAQLDEQARAQRPPGHAPSNIASLKVEQARGPEPQQAAPKPEPTPEPAPKRAADFLSASPNHAMTSAQLIGFNTTAGRWNEQQAQEYQQQYAALRPIQQAELNATKTKEAWAFAITQEAKTITPEQIAARYRALPGQEREEQAEKFEKKYQALQQPGYGQQREDYRQASAEQVVKLEVKERAKTPELVRAAALDRANAPHMDTPAKQHLRERDMRVRAEQHRINDQARNAPAQERERSRSR